MEKTTVTRREFVSAAGAAAAALTIVPRHVVAGGKTPPSEKLNIAGVGVGGMGSNNLNACKTAVPARMDAVG